MGAFSLGRTLLFPGADVAISVIRPYQPSDGYGRSARPVGSANTGPSCGTGCTVHGDTEWHTARQGVNAVELPAADGPVNRARPVAAPVPVAAEGQFVESTEAHAIRLINFGEPALDIVVGVKLGGAGVERAARVVDGFRPGEGAQKLQSVGKAAFVLRLQRVVDGLAAIVGYGDAAKIGEQARSWIAGIQIKQLLIGVVVSSEARSVGADVSKAQRLIGTELTLHLQVVLRDLRDAIRRKPCDGADVGWGAEIKAGKRKRQGPGGLYGFGGARAGGWTHGSCARKCDAETVEEAE